MTVAATAGVQYAVAGKDTHLSLIVKGSHPDGTAAKFEIKKALDDSLLDTIDGQVKKNKATTIWAAKGPEETGSERAHRVYYVVTVNDTEKTTSPEMEVYHDAIEVTSQKEDGSSLPDVAFVLSVKRAGMSSKHQVKANTGSTGVFKVEGLPPGDVELTFASPARFVEWAEEPTATKRKAKLKPGYKAALVWPPAGTHKQWVNHKAKKGQPDWGSKLKVRVGVAKEDGPSRKGEELFLKLEYPPEADLSKRSKPATGLKGAKDVPGTATRTLLASKKIDKDGAEVEFEVELGLAGADAVKVHVGGTEACEDEVVEVTNWRKLYYQLTRPDTMVVHDMARTAERLEPACILYERVKELTVKREDAPPEVKNSWVLGSSIGLTDERKDKLLLIAGDHNAPWFRGKFDAAAANGKLGVDLTLCDAQFDAGAKKTPVYGKASVVLETAEKEVFLDDGKWAFPTSLIDGTDAFVSGKWEAVNPPKGKKLAGKLTTEALAIDKAGPSVKVVLPASVDGDPGKLVGDGTGGTFKIRVTFKVKAAFGPFGGWSDGAHQMVVLTKVADIFNDIVLHELGHNMRQTVGDPDNAPPKGLTVADHANAYQERGHSGGHCHWGLDAAGATHVAKQKPDGTTEYLDLVGDASDAADYTKLRKKVGTDYQRVFGTCVMYGGTSSRADTAIATESFCEQCLPFIKAASLEDVT